MSAAHRLRPARAEAERLRIAAVPRASARALGTDLLQVVVGRARDAGCTRMVVEVGARNHAAVEPYRRAGFG